MKRSFFSLLIFLVFFYSMAFSQTPINTCDFSKIHSKNIRNFLKSQQNQGIQCFEDFKPSVTEQTDSSQFDYNVHRFRLRQAQATAWNAYLSAHPATIWQGKVVSCGLVYSPNEKRIIFPEDKYPGLEVGQVFFIEMRVLFGLAHFPVCFVVTRIDEVHHLISFSYVSTGSSQGSQTIQLVTTRKGGTTIIHSSIHLTENKFRDKTLYPIYHKKAIGEIHHNIKERLNQN